MNQIVLAVILALLQQIKPEDIANGLAFLVQFLDPVIAKRGFVIRTTWKMLRGMLMSPDVVQDVEALIADLKVHSIASSVPV